MGIEITPAELSSSSEINREPKINLDTYTPRATHWGELELGNKIFPCYVLDSGERVFSLKGIVKNFIIAPLNVSIFRHRPYFHRLLYVFVP